MDTRGGGIGVIPIIGVIRIPIILTPTIRISRILKPYLSWLHLSSEVLGPSRKNTEMKCRQRADPATAVTRSLCSRSRMHNVPLAELQVPPGGANDSNENKISSAGDHSYQLAGKAS
jgi:hypothetical protein